MRTHASLFNSRNFPDGADHECIITSAGGKSLHFQNSATSIAGTLTNAAGVLTVIVLMIGLGKPSDPKSMFDAFYVFVFYFACVAWGLDSRITASELAAREQLLRIEYRLADIALRLGK